MYVHILTLTLSHYLWRSLNHNKVETISFSPHFTIPNAMHAHSLSLSLSLYAVLCHSIGLSLLSYFHSRMYSIILSPHYIPSSSTLSTSSSSFFSPTPHQLLFHIPPFLYPPYLSLTLSLTLPPTLFPPSLPPYIRLKDFRSALHPISYGVLKRT